MVTRIRLHGGPGDGLRLAIDTETDGEPPTAILYDPDAITVYDADAGGPRPAHAGYYTRATHVPGQPWDYRFDEPGP